MFDEYRGKKGEHPKEMSFCHAAFSDKDVERARRMRRWMTRGRINTEGGETRNFEMKEEKVHGGRGHVGRDQGIMKKREGLE